MSRLEYDYAGVLEGAIGAEHGISQGDLEALAGRGREVHESLMARREAGELGFFDLLETQMPVAEEIAAWAAEQAGRWDAFVHIGIGGSGLGPICVQRALRSAHYNENPARREHGGKKWPRFYVIDNVDPEALAEVEANIDISRTLFHVVSKSGTTAETMTAFMYFLEKVAAAGGESALKEQIAVTTDPKVGVLRPFAEKHGLRAFPIPPNVGGRFSVLTPVGLVPAAMAGVDVAALLRGAGAVQAACESSNLLENPAYLAGAIHWLLAEKRGKSIAVMMPYSNALRGLSEWFSQLWAESLGKALNVRGETVNVGQTPVAALGATDQHSQVQLYAEGPNDKLLTFLEVAEFRADPDIPAPREGLEPMAHFGGKKFSTLLNAEKRATAFALAKAQRPTATIHLDKIDEEALGALFHFFELQTAFAGGLYEIDAFDQPGVEEGKKATHALLGRGTAEDDAKLAEVKAFDSRLAANARIKIV